MKLVIAEKSIAGKRISEILSEGTFTQKTRERAPLFLFEFDKETATLVPLKGHIMDVDFPHRYSQWIGTDLRKLAKAEIEYKGTEESIISLLEKVAPEVSEAIIATDSDREGEAIGLEAVNVLKEKNPEIRIRRASFSAITPKEITDAFSSLGAVDYNFAESANARREIDLIWGAVLTRFLSLVSGRFGKSFLSVGRVQTPVLALIVEREKERLAFKPKDYWEVKAQFEKDKVKFTALHKKGRFWDKAEAERVMGKKTGKGLVKNVTKKERVLSKPFPFSTTLFLRAASSIGFTAGEAMRIAEHLYMNGFISYPRTDNTVYPASLDLKQILNQLLKTKEFFVLTRKILGQKQLSASAGKKASKDHPPIHPVSAVQKEKLSLREWRIYELVVRRFLATLSKDALVEDTAAEIHLKDEPFIARGQIILEVGWKEFYHYSPLKEELLPLLSRGDEVKLLDLSMEEKRTQPPTRYSQGTLIKLMESLGLGTKSTRHEIISKLYYRQYISGLKAIEANKLAFAVIDSLKKNCEKVVKPKMTADLEKEMDLIAAGKKSKEEVVDESREILSGVLNELLKEKDAIGKELRAALVEDSIVADCTSCDGRLRILVNRNGKRFLGCTNYPNCTTTYPLPQKGHVSFPDKKCEFCEKPMVKVIGRRYRYEMCLDPDCESKKDWKKKKEEKAKESTAEKQSDSKK